MSAARHNDIAIIGLSCRLPGAATAEEYWKNLCDGVESVTFFSDQDLIAANVDPSLVANPSYVKAAAMLRDVEMFDASFFGYSPRDAALMDPQHRLFLEVCWEAFENAGYNPAAYPGKIGVLATAGGVVTSYLLAKLHHPDLPGQTASTSHINNDKDFLSTRISYKLNLTGPSFTIQSACSSSLLAVHQACQNLRFGECDMMLVGGSVVRVPQVEGYLAEKRNVHSLDGRCRPFDAVGQGTIFGSGVGVVLLKPLRQAIADRDHIFAIIKGTAANNDGSAKNSYTAPSLGQQSQAVADALKSAEISADSVGYVECHATGTLVGDPLEIEALTKAFRKQTGRKQYCAVGSVKANIGHPEQAAGIAGLIKTALVLHHKRIPPSINFQTPNPAIDFASSPFYVNTTLRDFPGSNSPRRAAVNSLGIGGTNAFAVLEETPLAAAVADQLEQVACLVTLSAKSANALVARVEQLLNWLNDNPDAPIGDVCYTTNVSRSQFGFRFAAPARSIAELKKRITAWLRTVAGDQSRLQRTSALPIAFMFSGQGSQHGGMGAKLYHMHAVFRNAMDRCDALAAPNLEQGLLDVIFAADGDAALVNRTEYTQPALFAVQYALTELLKSWGIAPNAVIGHSLGEFTAALAAEVMTLEDAMRLVTARGALMRRMPSSGGMTAIFAQESVVRALLKEVAAEIDVAAINAPENTVVSGELEALRTLSKELHRRGISFRELQVSNAFHSQSTEPILDDLENAAGQIEYQAPKRPLISNLTGELMAGAPDKLYWRRHLRETVRFGDGMLALAELGCRSFLEIGPHPVLLPMAQACLSARGKSATWIATLYRQKPEADSISDMLAALYLAGHDINWTAVHADASWRRIPLPTYPFQRQRHWLEEDAIDSQRTRKEVELPHPLIGARVNSTAKEVCYEAQYGVRHVSFFSDHRVAGTIVLPTTAELEVATVVGRTHFGSSRVSFESAMHHQAMSFANGEDRTVRVLVTPQKSDRASFKLISADTRDSKVWHTHITGTLRKSDAPPALAFSTKEVRARCRQKMPADEFYERLDNLGLEYGPGFRGVREFYLGQHEALAKVHLADGLINAKYLMHPAFLDACLHAYPLVLDGAAAAQADCHTSYLPISLERFRCYQDGIDKAWAHVSLRSVNKDDTQVVDIRIYDDAEQPVADLEGLAVRLLPLSKVQPLRAGADDLHYRMVWRKSVRDAIGLERNRAPASWMIFADAKGNGAALADRLEAAGHRCHLVYRDGASIQQGANARTWTADERKPHEFRRLLGQFAAREPLPCHGVVYLWGLDAPPVDGLTLAGLKRGCETMCRGALALLQALAETRSTISGARRLWFVTTNTQKIDGQHRHVDPVQAPLWGLGRTAAIEYPGLWGGLIDLQQNGDRMPDIDVLAAEFLHPDGETQIAISADNQRNVARLVRQPIAELPAQALRVRADVTYLVTGGLGMLGRSVVEWLLSKGAKHLVLTGRSANSEAARELKAIADTSGATIDVVAADISRDEEVNQLLQTISDKFPPLKGVVHSAGVLDDGILALLDWDRFSRVFEPKVYGSWLLHERTKLLDLDFLILQSSLLSLLGSAGQANYSAGNTFLDSLAAHRRSAGLPATAINWSAWSGGGLATVSGARGEAMWSSLGVKFIPPDLAMPAFDELMHHDVEQIAVAIADWPTYAGKVGKPPFLAELLNGNGDFGASKSTRAKGAAAAPHVPVNDGTHQQLLVRLQQRITAELGFAEPIDLDRPLNEVGLDSLRSVTLANDLEDEFGILISISQLISGPTISQLADHLTDLLAGMAKDEAALPGSAIASGAAIGPLHKNSFAGVDFANSRKGLQHVTNGHAFDEMATDPAQYRDSLADHADTGTNEATAPASNVVRSEKITTALFRPAHEVASRAVGKWLIAPLPNPNARTRLFCFPYAGGGLASFRDWAQRFNGIVEVVAVEAPGRGTRINEVAVDDLEAFVAGLLSEMVEWLDRPSAFFGHCLGGLTMFATLRALPKERLHFVKHAFACGVRPPQLLKRNGAFEDNLVYDMMLNPEFDVKLPPFAQTDEIFADIIRQFEIPAANTMLKIPRLRKILLPTIRAEFGMAYNYSYQPAEPFSFPISSFVGDSDPWVSEKDSAGWSELTRGGFTNHVCKGSHFLMADDGDYIVEAITNEFVNSAIG
jgi:acyl transferase domain-containing protein/surfactin synthase thioesterase subunit/acyl carrier protein